MKMRITLAVIAAVATLSLTACGSQTKGTAVPGLGGLGAPSVATGTANGDSTDTSDTQGPATDETTADATTADGPTTGTTADGPAPDQSSPSAMPGMPAGCQELANLAQDFTSKILQKAMNGGVTQADVDAVFSDANMAKLPDSVKGDATTLKDLSQQMVGKQVTELTDILPKVQTTFRSIASKVTKACGG